MSQPNESLDISDIMQEAIQERRERAKKKARITEIDRKISELEAERHDLRELMPLGVYSEWEMKLNQRIEDFLKNE